MSKGIKKKGPGGILVVQRPHIPAKTKAQLDKLVDEAIVDAYDESEQRMGFCVMIGDHLGLPFETDVLGIPVLVEKIDMTEAGIIVAECKKGNKKQRIPVLDLPLPKPAPKGAEWIQAYRYWVTGRIGPGSAK